MQQDTPPPSGDNDRSTIILVLGILSLIVCQFLGPVAWIMGRDELQKIAHGQVTSRNEAVTKAGMICGMIATILLLLGVLLFVVYIILGIAGAIALG